MYVFGELVVLESFQCIYNSGKKLSHMILKTFAERVGKTKPQEKLYKY